MSAIRHRNRTLERGIEWLPRHDAHYILARMMVSSRQATPICIKQDTLRAVEESVQQAAVFSFGLLTGSLCHCRSSERDYTLIDGWQECEYPGGDGDVYGNIAHTLREQIVLAERTGATVIGFFLSGTSVLPRAAREDVALFRAVFEHPWNVMLLRDRLPDGEVGAFMRVESMDEQPYAAPFTELLPATVRSHRDDVPATVVKWTNYQPVEVVRQYRAGEDVAAASSAGEPWHRGLLHRTLVRARMAGGTAVSAAASRLRGDPGMVRVTPGGGGPAIGAPTAQRALAAASGSVAPTGVSAELGESELPVVGVPEVLEPEVPAALATEQVEAEPVATEPEVSVAVVREPVEADAVEAEPAVPASVATDVTAPEPALPRKELPPLRLFDLPPPNEPEAVVTGADAQLASSATDSLESSQPIRTRTVASTTHSGHARSAHFAGTEVRAHEGNPSGTNSSPVPFELIMVPPRELEHEEGRWLKLRYAAVAVLVVALGIFAVAFFVRPG